MNIKDKALDYFQTNYNRFLTEYIEFLKIPSVSTDPAHTEDISAAATFLVKKLEKLGFTSVKAHKTILHPIVLGEYLCEDSSAPTILVYGHYDVQPPDPLNEWTSEPFNPTLRDDYIYARGASDMKGQILASIYALESILKGGRLPVNVKFILEGEEEIGSPSLITFLTENKDFLKADMVLNPDAGMIAKDRPTIVVGLRGLAYFELVVYGPKADLHSGQFGGIVENPAHVLSKIISKLHDNNGKVSIPGFYDRVRPLSDDDREKINSLNISDERYKQLTGVPNLYGEAGFTPIERAGARPTLDVNGLYSGFIGDGAKTIIPAYAKAKISCRLVPDQDPEEIHNLFSKYVESIIPNTVRYEIIKHSGAPAYLGSEAPGLDNLSKALEDTWGEKVVYKREGGSIPVATWMKNILGVDSILFGFGLPDDQIHSPNERQHIPTWKKGVEALISFFLSFTN